MPHLTEIQKKHAGNVNVVGVNIWEEPNPKDNSFHSKVEKYVADMGDQMGYKVAADTHEGKIAKAWMEASEGQGIPTAFIVGKDGTVMWIGHPMMGMDQAIEQILAGTYDLESARKKDAARRAGAKAQRELMAPIREALGANDVPKAVRLIDEAMAKNPMLVQSLGPAKFNLLVRSDSAAAQAWAKELSEGALKDDPQGLNMLAWAIVDDASPIKNPDYALAASIAERGAKLVKDDDMFAAYILDTWAYALFKDGKLDRAIEVQTRAVKVAEAQSEFDAETLKEIKDRLAMMRKKKDGN